MPDGPLTTVEVTGGDPLVVEVILPPVEARVVDVILGLAGPAGQTWDVGTGLHLEGGVPTLALDTPVLEAHGGTGVANLDDAPVLSTGGTTHRTLGARARDVVNVRDYGAVMDGTTSDQAALTAAFAATPALGTAFIPAGNINPGVFAPTSKFLLWKLDGTYNGSGTTPFVGIGTGVIESFLATGTKFFSKGRTADALSFGPTVRVDLIVNHTDGPTGGLPAFQSNAITTAASTADMVVMGGAFSVIANRTADGGPEVIGLLGSAIRPLGAGSAQIFAGNFSGDDRSMQNSSQTGSVVGLEVNIKANKLDDGLAADGYQINEASSGANEGANRIVLDLKFGRSDRADSNNVEFSNVLNFGIVDTDSSWARAKNYIRMTGRSTFAAINLLHLDTMAGQALALQSEQTVAWTAAPSDTVPTSWNYLQYTTSGGNRLRYVVGSTELWAMSDAGRMSLGVLPTNAANDAAASAAGVPVGGVYRNGSALMVRAV